MKRVRLAILILSCFLLIFTACREESAVSTDDSGHSEVTEPEETGTNEENEPATPEETDSIESSEPDETGPSETENESSVSDVESDPSESAKEEDPEGTEVFFGKLMQKKVASVNRKTLSNPASMLFDLTSNAVFTANDICDMINAYAIPESGYLGTAPIDDDVREALRSSCNLEPLWKRTTGQSAASPVVEPGYGLLVTNADVRSFPTDLRCTKTGDAADFDLFQETKLPFASGVLVLNTSLDGTYSFCQGEYYAGWIRTEEIAFTDRETFLEYLTPEVFAVSLGTDRTEEWNRMGLIFPVTLVTEEQLRLQLPTRTADGQLILYLHDVYRMFEKYSLGFLEYSPEKAAELALRLLDTPYGWGDENGYYDCSGFTQAVFRCFGYFLPRNSSIMSSFGGTVIDLSDLDDEAKLEVLKSHPGSVVSWPGHAMFFRGTVSASGKERFEIIQEGTGYRDESGTWIETNRVTVTDLLAMYRSDGSSFLSSLQTLIAPE